MTYDFKIIEQVLNETEKRRALCLFFNSLPAAATSINWEKATADYGAASVNSMKVSHGNMLKKIAEAGGKLDGTASASATPKKAPASTTPKKRKVAKDVDNEDDDEDADTATPTKKKRTPKGKKGKAAAAADAEDDTEMKAKPEPED